MSDLVVVESPSKTKKLESFLGKGYKVISSVGHVRDLPKSGLAVDVEHDFEPDYVISEGKEAVVKELKREAKKAGKGSAVYLATDPDREGEAIAWHVKYIMSESASPKFHRVTFNSITKDAVLEGFKHPRELDMNLINAQQARRVLDRLVGYKLSPLLWEKVRYGLSAGRVQSVAVRFVVEREREIEKFAKDPYFEFEANFDVDGKEVPSRLERIDAKGIYKKKKFKLFAGDYSVTGTTIGGEDEAKKIVEAVKKSDAGSRFKIVSVEQKDVKSHPSPPFTTSTLQQAASTRLGYSPKRTMQLAQKLYEGGYITYMRTDSVAIVLGVVSDIRKYVRNRHGEKFLSQATRFYRSQKEAKTQEAHEAVRPTKVNHLGDDLPKSVVPQERKLYELIWQRTIASQMAAAVFASTKIIISDGKYDFEARGSVRKFAGFLQVYPRKLDNIELPQVQKGVPANLRTLNMIPNHLTPPPRYNESSLVKVLESFGIGRPSTYAAIISTVQARGYVNKDEGKLFPTDNGFVVNDLLVEHFADIVDIDFTAQMEGDLDEVAVGKLDWRMLMKDFYTPFEKNLVAKKKEIKKEDVVVLEKTKEKCPECKKGNLIVKLGKFGKFLSCDRYPDCKYARPVENHNGNGDADENGDSKEVQEILAKPCPKCNGELTVKSGRFGNFIACKNYPDCKFTQAIQDKIGMKCPKCGKEHDGQIVIKKTKKGRTFYGCSRYPECDYASWQKPKPNLVRG